MATGRVMHQLVTLPGDENRNATSLVIGGQDGLEGQSFATCEIFHADNGTWSPTGSMEVGRYLHRAAVLPSGRVLVAGGLSPASQEDCGNVTLCPQYVPLNSSEIYHPRSGTWAPAADMPWPRFAHSMLTLPTGKVGAAYFGVPLRMQLNLISQRINVPAGTASHRGTSRCSKGRQPALWEKRRSWCP